MKKKQTLNWESEDLGVGPDSLTTLLYDLEEPQPPPHPVSLVLAPAEGGD